MVQLSVPDICDHILVRGVNWIGDAVMTMPALHALKRSVPGGTVTLLIKPWVAPLFEKDPNIDEIILYTDAYKGIGGRIRLAARLRRRRFCAAVLLQNAFDAALIAFLSGISLRVGYGRDGRRPLLTASIPFDDHAKRLHHVDYYLNLLRKAGFPADSAAPWLYLSIEERIQARERLSHLRRPVVGINPGATYGSSKRWRADRFAAVAASVIRELRGSIVIFGGPAEAGIANEVRDAINVPGAESDVFVAAGKTGLRELAALISECDVLVTNDSGPMHVGYAVGTPVVAIFGSTSPELTGPPSEGSVVIKKDIQCAPCFERECGRGDFLCMQAIEADEVFSAVRKLSGSRPAVFFDRDGTLCRDAHFLSRMEDLHVFSGIQSLRRLKDKGYLLIGVSNQSGVARGLVEDGFVRRVNEMFIREYGLDAFYYCPHHPDDHCSCRKPEPGLLYQARNRFGLDLKRSFVVGDKEIDMLLAKSVGARGIQVRTGAEGPAQNADIIVEDLEGAVAIIDGRL